MKNTSQRRKNGNGLVNLIRMGKYNLHKWDKLRQYVLLLKSPNFDAVKIKCCKVLFSPFMPNGIS